MDKVVCTRQGYYGHLSVRDLPKYSASFVPAVYASALRFLPIKLMSSLMLALFGLLVAR